MGSIGAPETWAIVVDSNHEQQQHSADLLMIRSCKNEEMVKLLESYFHTIHKDINFDPLLQQYLITYQSLIQDGEAELPLINASNLFHHQFFSDLDSVYSQHQLLRETLQSFRNQLTYKLYYTKFWTMILSLIFIVGEVIISAVGAATARKPAAVAVVAAATIILGAIGKWVLSLLNKYKQGMKKQDEMTRFMLVAASITINNLSNLYLSARGFEFQTNLVVEMADSGEVSVALMEGFQELRVHAAKFRRDSRLAREVMFQSVLKHLDYFQN